MKPIVSAMLLAVVWLVPAAPFADSGASMSASELAAVAQARNEIELCRRATTAEDRIECAATYARLDPADWRDCERLADLVIEGDGLRITGSEICLGAAVNQSGDVNLCRRIGEPGLRSICIVMGLLAGADLSRADISLCDQVSGFGRWIDPYLATGMLSPEGTKQLCITAFAMSPTLEYTAEKCERIEDRSMRSLCFYMLAKTRDDASFCARIPSASLRMACERIIGAGGDQGHSALNEALLESFAAEMVAAAEAEMDAAGAESDRIWAETEGADLEPEVTCITTQTEIELIKSFDGGAGFPKYKAKSYSLKFHIVNDCEQAAVVTGTFAGTFGHGKDGFKEWSMRTVTVAKDGGRKTALASGIYASERIGPASFEFAGKAVVDGVEVTLQDSYLSDDFLPSTRDRGR